MSYPRKYPVSGAEPHLNELDWNAMVDRINGLPTVPGDYTFQNAFDYIVFSDGVDYYGCNSFNIVFGGPDDAGGVDGASLVDVLQACINNTVEGIVWLLNIDEPDGITLNDDVALASYYGISLYKDTKSPESAAESLFVMRNTKEDSSTRLMLSPNGTPYPTQEWISGIVFTMEDIRVAHSTGYHEVELLFNGGLGVGNEVFLINSWDNCTPHSPKDIVFYVLGGDSEDPLNGEVMRMTYGGGGGGQRIIISRGRIPYGYPLIFTTQSGLEKCFITATAENLLIKTSTNGQYIQLETYDGENYHHFNLTPWGDVEISTAGMGVVMKTPNGEHTYRVAIDNNGDLTTTLIS